MIQIRKETDYALVMIAHLMTQTSEKLMRAKEIAKALKIPYPMASKVLKLLQKANILTSVQGPSGGYFLKQDIHALSLGETIERLEGPFALTQCAPSSVKPCKQMGTCQIHPHWVIINRVIRHALFQIPLTSLAFPVKEMPQMQGIEKIWKQFLQT